MGGLGLYSAYSQPKPEDTCNGCLSSALPLVFLGNNHGRLGDGYFADLHMKVGDKDRQECFTMQIESGKLVAPSREIVSQNIFETVRPFYHFKHLRENPHRLSDESLQRLSDNYQKGIVGAKLCSTITGDPATQAVCQRIPGKAYAYAIQPDWTHYPSEKTYFNAGVVASYLSKLSTPTAKEISQFKKSQKKPESTTNVWLKRKDLPEILQALNADGVPTENIKCDREACYTGNNNTKSIFER